MNIELHNGDLPKDIANSSAFSERIAVDTEAMGLKTRGSHLGRDRLCLIQLSGGDGVAHLVRITSRTPNAPNIAALLTDSKRLKLMHFARFDMGLLQAYLGVETVSVFCTRIASRIARTYSPAHGLKDLCNELLGITLDKEQQSSDWGGHFSKAQMLYAANDVLYLHRLHDALLAILEREGRLDLAIQVCNALQVRVDLDLAGWEDIDIFSHSS